MIIAEANWSAWLRVALYAACLIRYGMYWYYFEHTPGNGGKRTLRLLLFPFMLYLLIGGLSAFGKATDWHENLQVLLIVPGLAGVVCLTLIERRRRT